MKQLSFFVYFIALAIALSSCNGKKTQANSERQAISDIQDSIHQIYRDSLNLYKEMPLLGDHSLDKFFRQMTQSKTKTLDTQTAYQLQETKDTSRCITRTLIIDDNYFESKSGCVKKGAFWTEFKLNEKIIHINDIKALTNRQDVQSIQDCTVEFNQKRIFRVNGRKFMSLSLIYNACNGTGCMFDIILLYDFSRKQVFTTSGHSIDTHQGNFGDFNGDGIIDYISVEYTGKGNIYSADTIILRLYSQTPQGNFQALVDNKGKQYSVKAKFENTIFHPRNLKTLEDNWVY